MTDEDRPTVDPGRRRPGPAPRVVQLGSPGQSPFVLGALIAAFVLVAVVKPWPAASGQTVVLVEATPTPTAVPTADPLELVRRECQEPRGWRTYSRERWSRGTLHSWTTLEPASGPRAPLDPNLPTIPFGTEVLELGFCVPYTTADRPPAGATVEAWRLEPAVDPTRPRAVALALVPAIPGLALPYGGMFRPPTAAGAAAVDLWPPATYVFAVRGVDYERWWATELDPPLRPISSGSPTSSAGPDGTDPAATDQPVP